MNTKTYAYLLITFLLVFGLANAEEMNLTVESSPRPIAAVARILSARMGHVITYEDPRYEYQGDLRLSESKGDSGVNGPKLYWPVGGSIDLRGINVPQQIAEKIDINLVSDVFKRVLDSRANVGNGGKFKLFKTGNVLHVIPESVRDKGGRWVPQSSMLDLSLIIPRSDRTARSMINEICKELERLTGYKVVDANPAFGSFLENKAVQGADSELARDVLMRTLDIAGGGMGWELLNIPSEAFKGYFLYVSQLPKDAIASSKDDPRGPLPKEDPPRTNPTIDPTSGVPPKNR